MIRYLVLRNNSGVNIDLGASCPTVYNRSVRIHSWLAAAIVLASPLAAQWVKYPTPGTPRMPDGRPNLSAPAPRTSDGKPDLSGLWRAANNLPCDGINRVCTDLPVSPQFFDVAVDLKQGLPYQPWAKERMKNRRSKDDHYLNCIVPGGPRMHLLPTMKKIVQTPTLLLILNEFDTNYRQIFMDGRPLPEDPNPTWNGYSIGKWEGDTLVAQSLGYRDDQELDAAGSPLTNSAKVTERFRRRSFGSLEIEVTVDDPKAYTRPFTVVMKQDLAPDTDLLDAPCTDNEKDVSHLPDK